MHFPSLAAFSSVLLALSSTSAASPLSEPVKRGSGIGQGLFIGLQKYAGAQFQKIFGSSAPCAEYFDGEFMAGTDQDGAPLPWAHCYVEGDQNFTQQDADVAKCLTNLHYVQEDTCISVKGSMCDNGYLDGGGRIQNTQLSLLYDAQLTADQSSAMQYAIQSMVGTNIRTDKTKQDAYMPAYSVTKTLNGPAIVSMILRYIGEQGC
ncbi:hypothetical protein NUU61_006487 [Penicillium alfredii]|uniref:Uncharacterized protein n=1 Tax=Penicillium alfredii TaxID=1506179 RepID=A0A9W9F0Z4_9EURO|nr:uncharacterized protein NUU61_006487 [Penicillium alfredii]KAJ5091617.1 hypothetical protein NUU61_006487 [Penicillium alfredii]